MNKHESISTQKTQTKTTTVQDNKRQVTQMQPWKTGNNVLFKIAAVGSQGRDEKQVACSYKLKLANIFIWSSNTQYRIIIEKLILLHLFGLK